MKRLLPILLLSATSLFSGKISTQEAAICFDSPRHDFATIAEDGGEVSHVFDFISVSQKPVVILSVSGGCSCTSADYSRSPIRNGERGAIVVHFDPMNQPEGKFFRKVIVATSEGNIPLTISGTITPRKKPIEEQYSIHLAEGVRIEANNHAFGYVEHSIPTRSSIGITNTGTKPATIKLTQISTSGAIDIHYPTILNPGEVGAIDFGYDIAPTSNIYGSLEDNFKFEINKKECRYPLIISAIAIDKRIEGVDKEWQKIELSENFIKFGTLKRTSKEASREIVIHNIGLEPLKIRKIECTSTSFSVRLVGNKTIPSDGESRLSITIDPSTCDFGAVVGRVTIVSNDPQQPTKSFRVSAIIEN